MAMNPPDELPRLSLAAPETVEEIARRCAREERAEQLQRESDLENSLAPFRVGSVPYLNAVPLTRGLEDQIHFAPPSELGAMLQRNELDAALLSVVEALFEDRYDILDNIAIASLGEVQSVFLAHRVPLEQITTIQCDAASLTSVNLLRVLLAERGLKPRLTPFQDYAAAPRQEAVLLIGDPALNFRRAGHPHQIWDLGSAWFELTNLPFVYAVWVMRRNLPDGARLRRLLREARDFGLETLDYIISSRTDYDYDFRKDYLGWHIHFHLGMDERRGIERFAELLAKHQLGRVSAPHYVA
jgi:chorismate dehydratase